MLCLSHLHILSILGHIIYLTNFIRKAEAKGTKTKSQNLRKKQREKNIYKTINNTTDFLNII